jgi:hypothetical protein
MYWKYKFRALCGRDRLSEFVVLNIDSVDHEVNVSRAAAKQRFKMVQVEVARAADFGHNDKTFIVNTHLGETLNYNDTVLGFDLDAINLMQLDDLDHEIQVPPVVLVKKTYPRFRKKQKHRLWKLKHLEKDADADEEGRTKAGKTKDRQAAYQKDYAMFIQDIEEDPELRQQIDLYRNDEVINELEKKLAGMTIEEKSAVAKTLDSGKKTVGTEERKVVKGTRKTHEGRQRQAESEEIRRKEEALIKASLKQKSGAAEDCDSEDDGSIEEDFPHIKMDELKSLEEQLAGMQIEPDGRDEDDDFEDEEEEGEEEEAPKLVKKA